MTRYPAQDSLMQDQEKEEPSPPMRYSPLTSTSSPASEVPAVELSKEELLLEKHLRRKLDFLIMPLVVLVYLMNSIDRSNYASARLQGLQADLHLTPEQYEVGLSIYAVGYMIMQVPSNALLNCCSRPSWYIGSFVIAWGLVSASTSQASDYAGILACRIILGIVEAPFFAGVLFYLSKWYTKRELGLRMSILYCGALTANGFGALVAAGILNGLAGAQGLAAWQWLYIIEGAITVVIGILIVLVLPDFPETWSALSPEQKHIANRRISLDAAGVDLDEASGVSQLHAIKSALSDPKTWLFAIMYHGMVGASGFTYFFPSLTATLGFSDTISLLLVAPPFIFIVIGSLASSIFSDRTGTRYWFFIYPVPIMIVGAFIFMFTSDFGSRYLSLFLLVMVYAMFGPTYAWLANAVPRPPAKRAAALAVLNSAGNGALIWTPFLYNSRDAPYYRLAMEVNIGLICSSAIAGTILLFYTRSQNRQLDRLENEDVTLLDKDLKMLQKAANLEGVDVGTARRLKKGSRYMV